MSALVSRAGDEDPLRALTAVAELQREVSRTEATLVRRARVRGASWEQIARVLGVSRQAVHKKYGGTRFGRG
ncbi:AsnC family protein [Cellulomonas sp. ATA003]|uniref:AsnC family protein n=1 Tax=Cellulomonas sp. ATA003 TaxID=3073064 RepID=UPI002873F1D6|nr:AsnC family protein [Cellulomonas sp. ATA003]WNB87574.1 AsnC family protein [Cellulomonas sp. ATA003]